MHSRANSHESATSVLCLYYPQQLLPGLVSVTTLRQHLGRRLDDPVTALLWLSPHISPEVRRRRVETFKLLLTHIPWVDMCVPDENVVRSHLSHHRPVTRKAKYLRGQLGVTPITDIHYAHDISADFTAQAVMQAFPDADRVCYGDALGVVYSNEYFERKTYPLTPLRRMLTAPRTYSRNVAMRMKRSWVLPGSPKRKEADYVIPILPCDPSGDFLPHKATLPVSEGSVNKTMDLLVRSLSPFGDSLDAMFRRDGRQTTLLLLGSYAESKLCALQQEIALYVEIIRRHVKPGTRLVLKAHSASRRDKVVQIVERLGAQYDVAILDECFDEVPIEILYPLVAPVKVLSLSYASVSLRYLHAADVQHVLDDGLIDKYFPPESRGWIQESNDLYLDQIKVVSSQL